jgi:hypothetical protein
MLIQRDNADAYVTIIMIVLGICTMTVGEAKQI